MPQEVLDEQLDGRSSRSPTGMHVPDAVVVGLCAHGLALARSLDRHSVSVVALESNLSLPGALTRSAQVHRVDDINSVDLVPALTSLARSRRWTSKPVLFLTNDRMVESVAARIAEVTDYYQLSWAHASADLVPLLRKEHVEQRCRELGLLHPATSLLNSVSEVRGVIQQLRFPVIFKPSRPLSSFKTIVVRNPKEIELHLPSIGSNLPVLAQEFIPGDDRLIQFGALYLSHGKVLARFEGRKLRSYPMGHTTVAIAEPDDDVHSLAVRFFEGLNLSGPVSLEVKRTADGSMFVIEPTVGRTDFWVDLCIANGVDLPWIEYSASVWGGVPAVAPRQRYLWINGERDPVAPLWLLFNEPSKVSRHLIRGVYLSIRDWRPFARAVHQGLARLIVRVARKAFKVISSITRASRRL